MVISTENTASLLRAKPPCLNEEKKLGPTCIPMAYMNKINPAFFNSWRVSASRVTPRCPKNRPTNNIHVVPNDTPFILSLDNRTPMVITNANRNKVTAVWEPKNEYKYCIDF